MKWEDTVIRNLYPIFGLVDGLENVRKVARAQAKLSWNSAKDYFKKERYEEPVPKSRAITPPEIDTIKNMIVNALLADGFSHKQWYLEKMLQSLGYDIKKVQEEEKEKGHSWAGIIAPW